MNAVQGILIVGGYGQVGRAIASHLIKSGEATVRIAGRDGRKSHEAAAVLGCDSARIDLQDRQTWDTALKGITVVVVCVDQETAAFPEHVLASGLIYIDITASDELFRKVEALRTLTGGNGGRAILSVGLAPGLTNLLVKACVERAGSDVTARIGVLLGLGDAHGPAAISWTLNEFRRFRHGPMPIETMAFGKNARIHPAIPFDFADQHVVARTLGLGSTRTVLAFDTPVLSRLVFHVLRFAAAGAKKSRFAQYLMSRLHIGSDRAALAVEVHGNDIRNGAFCRAVLEGRREADITALVASLVVEHALHEAVPAGVWHIEQITSIEAFAPALRRHGIEIEMPQPPASLHGLR